MTFNEIVLWIITFATGLIGMPIVVWLQNTFNWSEKVSYLVTAAVAAVLAITELYVTGYFADVPITLENFVEIYNAVFVIAAIFFGLFKNGAFRFVGRFFTSVKGFFAE